MDHEIRGRLESFIDDSLTEKGLRNTHVIVSSFKPTVSSIEDAMFGFIVGCAFSLYCVNIHEKYDRDINDDESKKFLNIMDLRAFSIKSKISEIVNL